MAGPQFERAVSSGDKTFNEDDDEGPLGEPLPKYKANLQTSGKALYTSDLTGPPGTLQAVYATSKISAGSFTFKLPHDEIAARIRRQVPEFVDYIAADTIGDEGNKHKDDELLFAKEQLTCFGQPVALVLARDGRSAREAAQMLISDHHLAWVEHPDPLLSMEMAKRRNAILGEKVPFLSRRCLASSTLPPVCARSKAACARALRPISTWSRRRSSRSRTTTAASP